MRCILSPLGIHTCFKPHHTLMQALVKLTECIPVLQKAGVIHRIPCKGCLQVYVGQTGTTLALQLKEYKPWALTSSNLAQLAVVEHAAQQSHSIDWEGTTVMDIEQQFHRRHILQSWHIQSETSTMNSNEGNLHPVYDLLVHHPHASPSEPPPTLRH